MLAFFIFVMIVATIAWICWSIFRIDILKIEKMDLEYSNGQWRDAVRRGNGEILRLKGRIDELETANEQLLLERAQLRAILHKQDTAVSDISKCTFENCTSVSGSYLP